MAKTSILTILIQLAKRGDADRATIKGLAELKSNIGFAMSAFAAFSGVAIGVGAALGKTVTAYVDYAAQVRETARLTGAGAEETSRLIQAADDATISYEALQKALWFASKNGVEVNIESIARLADQYVALHSPTERAEFLAKNFGKGGAEMGKLLEKGADGVRRMTDAISESLVLTPQAVAQAREYEIQMDDLNDQWEGFKIGVGQKVVPALNDLLFRMNNYTEFQEERNRLIQEGVTQSVVEANAIATHNLRLREQAEAFDLANFQMREHGVTAEEIVDNLDAAAEAEAHFNSELDQLNKIIGGELGQAQDELNAKLAEYSAQLETARTLKEQDQVNASIAEEIAAYNERAEAIMFNIQQELILNSQLPNEAKLAMITSLAVAYGEYDQATADSIMSTSEWIQRVEEGTLSEEAAVQWMKNATQNMKEQTGAAKANAGALGDFSSNTERAGERAADAVPKFEMMEEAQAQLGDSISSEALPAVSSLRLQLGSMPADGRAWNYYFNFHTSGSVPRVPSAGMHDQQITNSPLGGGFASGGWLTGGIDIVGDAPGGRMTPWTEAIIGGRYVLDAQTTRELYEAGMLDNALHHAYGGDLGSGGGGTGGGAGGRTPSRPSGSSGVRLSGSTGTRRPRRRTRSGVGTLSEFAPPPGAAVDVAAATAAEVVEPLASATESATQASLAAQQQQVTEGIQTRNVIQSGNAEMAGLLRETNELLRQGNTTLPRTITAAVEQVKG